MNTVIPLFRKPFAVLCSLALLLTMSACDGDDGPGVPPPVEVNTAQYISSRSDLNELNAALQAGIERLVHTSSMAAFGRPAEPDGVIDALEARGLDVTPGMIEKLQSVGDHESAAALEIIYTEEVAHVAAGRRWFEAVCAAEGADPEHRFQALVKQYFKGDLKRPFNTPARDRAGMPQDWYEPLGV